MMKRALALFELDGYGLEFVFQIVRQAAEDSIHLPGQNGLRQVRPLVASRHIIQATVLSSGIIQPNPASQVSQRNRSCPVRIILVPRHYPSVTRRLAKKLIVPKAHRALEQLRRRHKERWVP